MTRKNSKHSRSKRKNQSATLRFNFLDWLFLAVGLIASITTIITDHEHTSIYIAASLLALNCAIIGTLLSIKGRRTNFIFSFVNAITYCFVAWSNQFYGSFVVNALFYAPCAVIGFYSWGKHSRKNQEVIARKLTLKQDILLIIIFLTTTALLNYILGAVGGQSTLLDSAGNILVIFASILVALRFREQWLVWLASDLLQLTMWTSVNDPATLVLRIFFVISSIYGYINWRKLVKTSRSKKH